MHIYEKFVIVGFFLTCDNLYSWMSTEMAWVVKGSTVCIFTAMAQFW